MHIHTYVNKAKIGTLNGIKKPDSDQQVTQIEIWILSSNCNQNPRFSVALNRVGGVLVEEQEVNV